MRPSSAETSEPAWTKRKMLSMKSRTSWPWSRKYSAIVRPDRPTRRRAPGGSFIWPKTSATLSMMCPPSPDSASLISSSRSLPSRVRSPTPENTDTPPCSRARFAISSWISTVLPTPAPPKRPILPPRTYGAIRSTTLIPVSKISIFGERSWKSGGSRWIGQRSVAVWPPLSSIGSPSTFQSRPSVAGPTGTEIGWPVSTTSVPRASPSVVSSATARTRSSPRCCCTSATRWPPSGR